MEIYSNAEIRSNGATDRRIRPCEIAPIDQACPTAVLEENAIAGTGFSRRTCGKCSRCAGLLERVCAREEKQWPKVAAARKLAVRLYWMLRTERPYPQIVPVESSSRVAVGGES